MDDEEAKIAKNIGTGITYAAGIAAGSWLYVPFLTALANAFLGFVILVAMAHLVDLALERFN